MRALVFSQLCVMLVAAAVRFGPSGTWLLPLPLGAAGWGVLTALTLVLAVVHLVRDLKQRRAPWSDSGLALLWIVFVVLPGLHWSVGQRAFAEGADAPLVLVAGGVVLGFLWARRAEWFGADLHLAGWTAALRWAAPPTAVGLLTLAHFGPRLGTPPPSDDLVVALTTYPLYAIVQLGAMLVLPATTLRRRGVPPRVVIVSCTVLFALAHWPNPFAIVASFFGMTIWSLAWTRGSALLPLAISMGLLAAVATQRVPLDVTAHMRVGPGYVLRQIDREEDQQRRMRTLELASKDSWDACGGATARWLQTVHTGLYGAEADSTLLEAWSRELEDAYRAQIVRYIFDSEEFRTRNAITTRLGMDEMDLLLPTFVPFVPAHARYEDLASSQAFAAAGRDHFLWIDGLYRELLGRPLHPSEHRHWPETLSLSAREQIVERLFARRHETSPMRRLSVPRLSLQGFDGDDPPVQGASGGQTSY